jgi:membrane fusion protein, copper/silver efflux system
MSEMRSTPRRRFGAAALAVTLAAGVALGVGGSAFLAGHSHEHGGEVAKAGSAPGEKKPTYVCPMHPTITSDHPADCPICGMKLVLVKDAAAPGGAQVSDRASSAARVEGLATVNIDPQRQQLIGLRTAGVKRGAVGGSWRTVGRVAVDETRVHHVNVKVAGFAEQVYVDYVGKLVKAGEPLFTIYSPDLLSVQEEYLLALRTKKALGASGASAGDDLVESARQRLKLWDVPESEIERLEKTGKPKKSLTLYAPMSGVVTKKDVVMGHRLQEGDMPYEITDLREVWVLADAYESDLARLRLGMSATLSLQAFPNRTFRGKVIFVDPLLDAKTRTAKVRLSFPNPTGELRPEMFGEVTLQAPPRDGLRVPGDAVIDSGTKKVVFVALGEGKFQPREVRVGAVNADAVEIVSGLAPGEEVVTRANFLVDSESRLRASLAAMGAK